MRVTMDSRMMLSPTTCPVPPDPVHDLVSCGAFRAIGYVLEAELGREVTRLRLVRPSGRAVVNEQPTSAGGGWHAMVAGLRALAANEAITTRALLGRTERVMLATDEVTGAIHSGSGLATALITDQRHTERVGDAPEMPPALHRWVAATVPPARRIVLRGRAGVAGPVTDATLAEMRSAAQRARALGCTAVAVAFSFPALTAPLERRLAHVLARELDGVHMSLAHQVFPESPEALRMYVTVLCAYVGPGVGGQLAGFRRRLQALGFKGGIVVTPADGLSWS